MPHAASLTASPVDRSVSPALELHHRHLDEMLHHAELAVEAKEERVIYALFQRHAAPDGPPRSLRRSVQ
jgi:hypothetical protein